MPFTSAFSTRNANASIHGPVSKRRPERIPGLIPPSRPSAVPFVEIQQMRAAHEAGEPIATIARRFGYDQGLVRNWCQYLQRVFA